MLTFVGVDEGAPEAQSARRPRDRAIPQTRSLDVDSQDMTPAELGWTPEGHLRIVWPDRVVSTYEPGYLRKICPCADCRGAHGGPPKAFVILSPQKVRNAPRQILIERVEPVGNYAIAFTWGDGHREGIYSWRLLRASAPAATSAIVTPGGPA